MTEITEPLAIELQRLELDLERELAAATDKWAQAEDIKREAKAEAERLEDALRELKDLRKTVPLRIDL